MTFNDIFKSAFLESVTEFSILDTVIGLAFALAIGLFIFLVYKKTFSGVMYSTGFALSLIGLSLVTTLVIMAVTSNVVLSLGMVGALSIVRFRAAIKEPMEIVFLFWAIAAGMIPLAVAGSVIIGIVLILFANRKHIETPYIVVINAENDAAEKAALDLVSRSVKRCVVKSKMVNASGIELTAEVKITGDSTRFINSLIELDGVTNAALVSYNGEYMS